MIETSPEIKDLALALHKAQGVISGVAKDSKNPAFKSRYASLEAVIDEAKPALQANQIVFTQAPGRVNDGKLELTTMLIHAPTGQWLRSTMEAPLSKVDPQGVGSATTYLCRYSLMAALGMPPIDDDAESATDRFPSQRGSVTFTSGIQPAAAPPSDPAVLKDLLARGDKAAEWGIDALGVFWNGLTSEQRKMVGQPKLIEWKAEAAKHAQQAAE